MIAGRMRHRDSAGHEGLLENGGVQWMTAGRGVIHSELPEQEDGRMEGFQLWLNLAGDATRCARRGTATSRPPRCRSSRRRDGVTVRVIAGASHGVDGAVTRDATEPLYLDLHLPAGARFEQALPADAQRVRLRLSRRACDRRHGGAGAAHGDPGQRRGSRRRGARGAARDARRC